MLRYVLSGAVKAQRSEAAQLDYDDDERMQKDPQASLVAVDMHYTA